MRGLFTHFKFTLLLNFRSRQALVYGYLVPVFFLIAFGSIFRAGNPPLLRQLGQLLTISVLGGACFGMPTALVAERERGVWRRYRLLPAALGGGALVVSTMAARFVIVLSAAVMQIVLAKLMYGMPLPALPVQMLVAFSVVTFAFLGMGLVIAMLANTVPAVQALGQAIFLPMIMIGGVGVPLWTLPPWAQHVAGFLPGKYAVAALDACTLGQGLAPARFDLLALGVIGAAGCVAGAKMFRWDAHERIEPGARRWVLLALLAWLSVGFAAEWTGRASVLATAPAIIGAEAEAFRTITPAQIAAVNYDILEDDTSTVTPVANHLDHLDADALARAAELRRQLSHWPAGKDASPVRRVRNLLGAASVADILQDRYEGLFAAIVFEKLQADFSLQDMELILTWIIYHPHDEHPVVTIPGLGVTGDVPGQDVEDRVPLYARKLLGRLTGKRPA